MLLPSPDISRARKKEGKGAKGARKSWWRGLADPFYIVLAVTGGLGMGITLVALLGSHHSPDSLRFLRLYRILHSVATL